MVTPDDPRALAAKAAAAASIATDRATDAAEAAKVVKDFIEEVRELRSAVTRSARLSRAWRRLIAVGAIVVAVALATLYLASSRNTAAIRANCEGRNTIATVVEQILLDAERSTPHLSARQRAFYTRSVDRLAPIPCTMLVPSPDPGGAP